MPPSEFDQTLERELRQRVDALEQPDHDFGIPFSRTDWWCAAAVVVICLAVVLSI